MQSIDMPFFKTGGSETLYCMQNFHHLNTYWKNIVFFGSKMHGLQIPKKTRPLKRTQTANDFFSLSLSLFYTHTISNHALLVECDLCKYNQYLKFRRSKFSCRRKLDIVVKYPAGIKYLWYSPNAVKYFVIYIN